MTKAKLQKSKFVTHGVMEDYVTEASETILNGVEKLLNEKFAEKERSDKARHEETKSELGFIRHDIKDLEMELSNTPSLRQFNELKAKVYKRHTSN